MAERFKINFPKRAQLPADKQRQLLFLIKIRSGHTWSHLAQIANVHSRTLYDWKREKFHISLPALLTLCKTGRISFPKHAVILPPFAHAKKAAKMGGRATYKKYGSVGGNPNARKMKWREWWEREGKFNSAIHQPRPIILPVQSEELAEFVGIMIGDGGITKYQITITLHFKDDKKYSQFVVQLIKNLFTITPKIHLDRKDSVNTVVISRIKLARFCVERLGLKAGNKIKQRIDVPEWIKKNKRFQVACLRGLIDTDGSVFNHCYFVKNKEYCYKRLSFTSASPPLIQSVYAFLQKLGFNPKISSTRRDVNLFGQNDIKRYMKIIGTHNPKHLAHYKN